jgi:hypothetical protein
MAAQDKNMMAQINSESIGGVALYYRLMWHAEEAREAAEAQVCEATQQVHLQRMLYCGLAQTAASDRKCYLP